MLRDLRPHRRQFALWLAGAFASSAWPCRASRADEPTKPVSAAGAAGTDEVTSGTGTAGAERLDLTAAAAVEMQVHAILEATGELVSRDVPGKPTKAPTFPLKVLGDLVYAERGLGSPRAGTAGALRWYQQARGDIEVARKPRPVALREERRHFLIQAGERGAVYRCLEGPLTREERDLLELPAATHCLSLLLPTSPVAVGETWSLEDARLAQLLNLDAVTAQSLVCQLDSCDDAAAQMSLKGKVLGAIQGVVTELSLQGKYQFDRSIRQVAWLALGIQESREAGLAEPGVRVSARLRVGMRPSLQPSLGETLQAEIEQQASASELLEYRPASGRFSLAHSSPWYLFDERPDLTVLRYIEGDRMVAQCNLRPMMPVPTGSGLTLDQFRDEIRVALGSSAQQVVDSREAMQPDGTRQLRVSVVGQVADTPIHWIYYHLVAPTGHRMTCAFTLAGDQMDRFNAEDANLVGGLNLVPAQESAAAASPEAMASESDSGTGSDSGPAESRVAEPSVTEPAASAPASAKPEETVPVQQPAAEQPAARDAAGEPRANSAPLALRGPKATVR